MPVGPSIGPATNSKAMRKMNPVETPIAIQAIIILGPSTVGLGISSIIWATTSNPVNPRPACNKPRSHPIPSGPPVLLMKSVKTNSAEL
jgi:hypothetical protein